HLVADDVLPVERESDVSADLADPHGLAFEAERRPPDAEMVALPRCLSRLLQRQVLATAEQVDRRDRRVPVLASEEVRPERLESRVGAHDLRHVPPRAREAREHLVRRSDQDEIERVLDAVTGFGGRTTWHALERGAKRGLVDITDLVGGVEGIAIDFLIV